MDQCLEKLQLKETLTVIMSTEEIVICSLSKYIAEQETFFVRDHAVLFISQ